MGVLTLILRCSGYCAFTHKAGIHAKAILNNPSTYEILKPEDFGLTRYVSIGYVAFRIPISWFSGPCLSGSLPCLILHSHFHTAFCVSNHLIHRHRLTGWNAVKSRVEQLKLKLTDEEVRSPINAENEFYLPC
jgi:homocitrate synthase